jgi:hypothetical protein
VGAFDRFCAGDVSRRRSLAGDQHRDLAAVFFDHDGTSLGMRPSSRAHRRRVGARTSSDATRSRRPTRRTISSRITPTVRLRARPSA